MTADKSNKIGLYVHIKNQTEPRITFKRCQRFKYVPRKKKKCATTLTRHQPKPTMILRTPAPPPAFSYIQMTVGCFCRGLYNQIGFTFPALQTRSCCTYLHSAAHVTEQEGEPGPDGSPITAKSPRTSQDDRRASERKSEHGRSASRTASSALTSLSA